MPAKGRRIASRQAQVGRRRRRQTRGPSGIPEPGLATAVAEPETQAADGDSSQPRSRPAVRPVSTTGPTRTARGRTDAIAASNYFKAEIIRILVMAGVLTAVLIVISFFI